MPNWARHAIARRIDIENNLNSCAPHTTGESGFAPTIAPVARTLNLYLRLVFFRPEGATKFSPRQRLGGNRNPHFRAL